MDDDEDFQLNDRRKFLDSDDEDYIPTAWEKRADVVENKPVKDIDLFSQSSSVDLLEKFFSNPQSRELSRKNSFEERNENLARNLKEINTTVDNLIKNWVEKDYSNKEYLTRSFYNKSSDIQDPNSENGSGEMVNNYVHVHANVDRNNIDDDIEILDKAQPKVNRQIKELQRIEE